MYDMRTFKGISVRTLVEGGGFIAYSLALVFVTLRILKIITWSCEWILSPIWIFGIIFFVALVLFLFFESFKMITERD